MQLPHGTLVTSRKGPAALKELIEPIAKEGLMGYLRVSMFDKNAVHENVIVYMSGKPVVAFASDGSSDRKDQDFRLMEEAVARDNAIIEVCKLMDKQVKLLHELYPEFVIMSAAASPAPAPKETPKEMPKARAPAHAEKPRTAAMPEIRGRFVRAESIGGLDEYVQRHPGETGHLLYMAQKDGKLEEEHVILIRGRIEAAYNSGMSGTGLLESLRGVPGHAEFYAIDEALLNKIINRQTAYSRPTAQAAAAEKPVPGIGIPAKELLEGPRPLSAAAQEDICLAVDEISGGMDDDLAMVRKIEREFASHVDELLSKLELSHLRHERKGRLT